MGIWLLRLALTAWLFAIAICDLRTGKVPNKLTLPIMLVFGLYRLVQSLGIWLWPIIGPGNAAPNWILALEPHFVTLSSPSFVWIAWLSVFILWNLHFMGGGDAKLLMGMLAVFARLDFVLVLALGILVVGVPLVFLTYRETKFGALLKGVFGRVLTGRILPTEKELAERGKPYAWLFCLPGVIYAWFLW